MDKEFQEPEGQIARWLERLSEYDYVVIHRWGSQHMYTTLPMHFPASSVVAAVTQWI